MIRRNSKLSLMIAIGLALNVNAADAISENVELDINSIVFIEDEVEINLGFDVNDYLPDDFNPYYTYFDLNAIDYIEEEPKLKKRFAKRLAKRLPKNFDAYAAPKGIAGLNFIDENDTIVIDFDTTKHLPEGFDPYIK